MVILALGFLVVGIRWLVLDRNSQDAVNLIITKTGHLRHSTVLTVIETKDASFSFVCLI
jgi:hypothetical protein